MLTTPAVSCLLTMCIFNGCDDISNHLVSRLLGGIYLKKNLLRDKSGDSGQRSAPDSISPRNGSYQDNNMSVKLYVYLFI